MGKQIEWQVTDTAGQTTLCRFDPGSVRLVLTRDDHEKTIAIRLNASWDGFELGSFLSSEDKSSFAKAPGMTERQLTDLFRRWCGLIPKSFAQAVALDHAKSLLRARQSALDTTYELSLSSTSRLHDLFVAYEAMPPGVFRAGREGLNIFWGTIALRYRRGHRDRIRHERTGLRRSGQSLAQCAVHPRRCPHRPNSVAGL
ncbi:MAG: helix-turn-helix domain-containing protein [Candidatus Devosia symbiotica]|nr:helix-turn-helix domain-containing protein [Candidatus Devosia symbiotica]